MAEPVAYLPSGAQRLITELPNDSLNLAIREGQRSAMRGNLRDEKRSPVAVPRSYQPILMSFDSSAAVANRDPGDVVKIGDAVFDANDNPAVQIWPTVRAYGEETVAGEPFAVMQAPGRVDGAGIIAAFSGYCWAKVNVTDAAHSHAEVVSGNYVLQSTPGDTGVRIHFPTPSVGESMYMVEVHPAAVKLYLCVSASEIQPGSTNNTVNLLDWDDASTTSETLTGVRFDFITDGEPISPNKQLIVADQRGVRRIVGAECDTEEAAAFIAPAMSSLRI